METDMTVQPDAVDVHSLPIEKQLEVAGSVTVERARGLTIANQTDYQNAAKFLQEIKAQSNRIRDYWKEPKSKAAAAHKDIVSREKAMLQPLSDAESIVKKSMRDYLYAVDMACREQLNAAKKQREDEAARLLQAAIDAQESGDDQAAAVNMAMAEMVSEMPDAPAIEQPKAAGISTRKQWKATVTNPANVPAYYKGMEIRRIDMSVLNSIARMTRGTAEIPGVTFNEESTLTVRS